ncbi:hypothetical protein SLNWT_3603 [Streptomyces albus]|uniref:Uncharacterized protein n=1 Tax=Streptomyces albus (strain ATCC 21838 / DSM 41398 / FERM P-419 / JCM 4703 / NBRC 107858) TaxID=1081613 RepID=A0A0B5EQV7_STRA4|nr:hypothetical protein SLNWT_3603 [Streptomyces albus]AOU78283.1 hypothetical protein SLNHY_3592 [Streptomyces albus]
MAAMPPRAGRYGSPPLARSAPHLPAGRAELRRLTSARAERTTAVNQVSDKGAAHLRSRGAHALMGFWPVLEDGSPPLARSAPRGRGSDLTGRRLTSARAERTRARAGRGRALAAHLRSRGAHPS